jgi:transposase
LRAQLAEFGVVAAQGRTGLAELMGLLQEAPVAGLPDLTRAAMAELVGQLQQLTSRIKVLERGLCSAIG